MKKIWIIALFLLINLSYAYSNDFFEVDIPDIYKLEPQAEDECWAWSKEKTDGSKELFAVSVVELEGTNNQNINELSFDDENMLIEQIVGDGAAIVKDSYIKPVGDKDYFVIDTEEDNINIEYYAILGEKNIYILASTTDENLEIISSFMPKDKIPGSSLKEKRSMTFKICGSLLVLILIAEIIIDANMKNKGMPGVIDCYIKMWRNTFKIKGRTSRKNYWIAIMTDLLITVSFALIINITGAQKEMSEAGIILTEIFAIIILISMIPKFTMKIRRLHDIGHGGTTYLVMLFPIFGYIFFTILMIVKGNDGENKYGDQEDKEVFYDPYSIT